MLEKHGGVFISCEECASSFLPKLNYVIILLLDRFMETILSLCYLTVAISVTTRRDNLQKRKLTWRVTQTFVMCVILLQYLESY